MKHTLAVCTMAILIMVAGCAPAPSEQSRFKVATTFFPLYDLTASIAGDDADVSSIVPTGVEPHDYEPTARDMASLADIDMYVELGVTSELSTLEDNIIRNAKPGIVIVQASSGIPLRNATDDPDERQEHMPEKRDPHVWLSPRNALIMADNIRDGLIQADPANREAYARRAGNVRSDLIALDQEFTSGLANCAKGIVLANHDAYSYMAEAYGFRTLTISGLGAEAEPSPDKIRELIDAARQHDIKYVMYEELVDPRVAQTIAADVDARVLVLSPLEGGSGDDTYVTIMRRNLANLRLALECS